MSATALRGTPPPGAVRRPRPSGEAGSRGPGGEPGWSAVPVALRLVAAAALVAFGAQAWGELVRPGAAGALLGGGAVGVAAAIVALRVPSLGSRPLRAIVLAALVLTCVVASLLLAGVPLGMLDPEHWDVLVTGVAQGIESFPGLSIPYNGIEEWSRIALVLSGVALAVTGPLLVTWPRRRRARGVLPVAAVLLATLHAVPAVQLRSDDPWLEGAVLAVLLGVLLFADRITPRGGRQAAVALGCGALVAVVVAPALDRDEPWLDYESVAEDISQRGMTRFSWNHSYGPLNWPREGKEVLRVRARQGAYWKATALAQFDGLRWHGSGERGFEGDPVLMARQPRWVSELRFTIRDMTSWQFLGAGTTLEISRAPRTPRETSSGVFVSTSRPLRRGHAYLARVYVPRPTRAQLLAEQPAYPGAAWPYLTMELPPSVGGPESLDPDTGQPVNVPGNPAVVAFPHFGSRTEPVGFSGRVVQPDGGGRMVEASAYGRMYRLAQRIAAGSDGPYDYVRRVEAYLQRGFSYTEAPPERDVPLPAFVFRDKQGYCQQFSGAMALLLRMGGVPARVASGFSPGTYDRSRKEYVVRDLDAHSWVEAYFPTYGWVTFDPTPDEAPARSQLSGLGARLPDVPGSDDPVALGDRASDPASIDRGQAPGERGVMAVVIASGVIGGLLLLAVAGLALRARRRRSALGSEGAIAELVRALRITRRRPSPGTTLSALEQAMRHAPNAAGYVRALRMQRYGGGDGGPTRAQRAALRRELGQGLGVRGRLRALRALPPW